MRDPKAHAKVLALRYAEVRRQQGRDAWNRVRAWRLLGLISLLRRAKAAHLERTGWVYNPHANPPHWCHGTEIIPDTEEDA